MKKYIIQFTKAEADSLGLFICKCGYPENNHFDFAPLGKTKRPCAHNPKCKNFTPKIRIGKLIRTL